MAQAAALHAPGHPPGHRSWLGTGGRAAGLGAQGRAETLSGPRWDTRARWGSVAHPGAPQPWLKPRWHLDPALGQIRPVTQSPCWPAGGTRDPTTGAVASDGRPWGSPAWHVPGPLRAPSGHDPWTTGRWASESRGQSRGSHALPRLQAGPGPSKPLSGLTRDCLSPRRHHLPTLPQLKQEKHKTMVTGFAARNFWRAGPTCSAGVRSEAHEQWPLGPQRGHRVGSEGSRGSASPAQGC